VSEHEYAGRLSGHVLRACGLQPRDAGLAAVPLRIRIWRAVTSAYRRGRVIDWRSCNAAEAEARAAEQAYLSALPGRMQDIADRLSEGLPDGMRFGWKADGE